MGSGVGVLAIGTHIRAFLRPIDQEIVNIARQAGRIAGIVATGAGGVTLHALIEAFVAVVAYGALQVADAAQVEVDGTGDVVAGVAVDSRGAAGRAGGGAGLAAEVVGLFIVAFRAFQSALGLAVNLEVDGGGVVGVDPTDRALGEEGPCARVAALVAQLAVAGGGVGVKTIGAGLLALGSIIEEEQAVRAAACEGAVIAGALASHAGVRAVLAGVGVEERDILAIGALNVTGVHFLQLVVGVAPSVVGAG